MWKTFATSIYITRSQVKFCALDFEDPARLTKWGKTVEEKSPNLARVLAQVSQGMFGDASVYEP
jgi:hypothetical protein